MVELSMSYSNKRLIILDADGTSIDAFNAIASTFAEHGMDIGDLSRFQKRHNLFKYLGGVKELPKNIKKQLRTRDRKQLIDTLTVVYREQACLYPGIGDLIMQLVAAEQIIVGVVTRNITNVPSLRCGCCLNAKMWMSISWIFSCIFR